MLKHHLLHGFFTEWPTQKPFTVILVTLADHTILVSVVITFAEGRSPSKTAPSCTHYPHGLNTDYPRIFTRVRSRKGGGKALWGEQR